ncbi:hypothetical protein [Beggiatoa leptomitoformis]|uniref:Uncharacterized protein n=1 Tax=Beggiatoa leptomitoformis TaxID=288004 RepID=A0A2N9YA69_9GAMM|nr:hypothetical protein [Beggiatoa leptomitoformis]ALG67227.1 hypothetical protein AL038_05265 [Beggiatoa leptomitoformis]AUI67359.1 hypothetical protein BLE401_00720 [Beggiatoa leptomitoformis]
MPEANLTISYVDLGATDQAVLKVATGLLAKHNDLHANILNKEDVSGHIVIVDVDNPDGQTFYNQFNGRSGRGMLILSNNALNEHRYPVLRKPVRVQTLRDVIFDLHNELQNSTKVPARQAPTSTAEADDADKKIKPFVIPPPVKLAELDNNLFFVLLKAQTEKQCMQIFCPPHSPLFVDPEKGIVATSASRETLRKMTHGEAPVISSTRLSDTDVDILAKGQLIIPFASVLWSAAVYGSKGQLIATHKSDVPVRLKAWPNLSRLDFQPIHMKLTTIMTGQTLTLQEIAQRFQIEWDVVAGFYNACFATGLLLINPTKAAAVVAPKVVTEKNSLFSKIAKRLKLG